MSSPVTLSSSPAPLPACRPGDDPMAEMDEPDAPANPLAADPPASCPLPSSTVSQLPPPDHPAARHAAPAPAPAAPPLTLQEKTLLAAGGPVALKEYQAQKARTAEVQQAHRTFQATGQIPPTKTPFAWIEILEGRTMSRSERYDAMLEAQGKSVAVLDDVDADERDPVYLTKEEFKAEFWAREKAEWHQCAQDYTRPGKIDKCQRAVDEKYGGESFKAWRDGEEARTGAMVRDVAERIEGVSNGGGLATAGRLVGGLLGWATGHDALKWSEYGAAIGGLGDAAAPVGAKKVQDARAKSADAAAQPQRIGAKETLTEGYGKGGTRLSPAWATKQRGEGVYDCVAATCARALREGEVVNSQEVLTAAQLNPKTVHEQKGLDMAQARALFEANGKELVEPEKGYMTKKGDYAVIVYKDGRPKHMVYMRVLGPAPGGTQSRGFYIDDPQMGVRFQGSAARAYLGQRHEVLAIENPKEQKKE